MNANGGEIALSGGGEPDPFSQLTAAVNERFLDATAPHTDNPWELYFLYGGREGMQHGVAVFCVANTVDLGRRRVERLGLAIPMVMAGPDTPRSVLGSSGENQFELTYRSRIGTQRSVLLTPDTYNERFLRRHWPPVINLLGKLGTYGVVPVRKLNPTVA
jgi:hypothetical protein